MPLSCRSSGEYRGCQNWIAGSRSRVGDMRRLSRSGNRVSCHCCLCLIQYFVLFSPISPYCPAGCCFFAGAVERGQGHLGGAASGVKGGAGPFVGVGALPGGVVDRVVCDSGSAGSSGLGRESHQSGLVRRAAARLSDRRRLAVAVVGLRAGLSRVGDAGRGLVRRAEINQASTRPG